MKSIRTGLFILHLIVGIGACAGGLACLLDPISPLGAPAAILHYSPFTTFLIPGFLLFGVIGIGNLTAATLMLFHLRNQGYISGVSAAALVIWIVVQCIMLRSIVFLHVLFFCIGIVEGLLAFMLLYEAKRFPAPEVMKLLRKVRRKRTAKP